MCVPACGCIPVEELWHRDGVRRSPRRHTVLSGCRATEGSEEGGEERWEEESETADRASNIAVKL